jgi:hypothetical protein
MVFPFEVARLGEPAFGEMGFRDAGLRTELYTSGAFSARRAPGRSRPKGDLLRHHSTKAKQRQRLTKASRRCVS